MSGRGAVGSKKPSRSSGIQIDGLQHTLEDESCIVLNNDIRMLRDSDRRYIKVGSSIILLTIIATAFVVAFSIYNLYLQFRLQEIGLKSVPYIASMIAVLLIGSAATWAIIYNSPRLGRIRRASEANRRWLISCKEDLVRTMVATIEKNADIISAGKESIKGIWDEEEAVIRMIEELHSAHELYSKVHELKKVRREAVERCTKEAHEVVSAMRDDFNLVLDHYAKLFNNKNTIRSNLREAIELARCSVVKLQENRAILAAKREEYRTVLVELEIASTKLNSFRIERGEADRDQGASSKRIEEREDYEKALKTYNDKKKLSDILCKEVDSMQVRVSELKRDIDFLNGDIHDMKTELDGITEKMDGIDRSLTIREANVFSAMEFRDSVSQDLMSELIKLAEALSSPWNVGVERLSSADKFFEMTERKKKVAKEIQNARERSFRAYMELKSIFSETSSSIIKGSEYLRAIKRRDFRSQMKEEWSGLDLSTLQQESTVEETTTEVPATTDESAATQEDDVLLIQEVGDGTESAVDSGTEDVARRESEASTSSMSAPSTSSTLVSSSTPDFVGSAEASAGSTQTASTSSTPAASIAGGKKNLIAVGSEAITRERGASYRSFFSARNKASIAAPDGTTDDKDVKTETMASTRSFFLLKKKQLAAAGGSIDDKEDTKVEGIFASWRKYMAAVGGGAGSKEAIPSKEPAPPEKKAHSLEGLHPKVKEIEKMIRSALASEDNTPDEEIEGAVASGSDSKGATQPLEGVRAESVLMQQQISAKKVV